MIIKLHLITFSILIGLFLACARDSVDLEQLQVGQPLHLDLESYASKNEYQNGHIETSAEGFKIVDDGEKVVNYTVFEDDVSQFNFSRLALNADNGVKISVYNGMLTFYFL